MSLWTQNTESKQFCNYSLWCVAILRKLENKLVRNAGGKGLLQTSVIIPDVSEH